MASLGGPAWNAFTRADTENASTIKIGTKTTAVLDFIQLPPKSEILQNNGRHNRLMKRQRHP
jgi:hypothetical protein